jgi:opacity protein-like surface antigen
MENGNTSKFSQHLLKTTRFPMKALSLFVSKAPSVLSVCLLSLFIGGVTIARAQEFQAGGYFTTIIPQGQFSENVTNNGYGGGGQFLVRLGPSPFLIGGDAGGVIYGSESRREPISSTIPNLQVRVRTNNNIFLAHFLLRVQPRKGLVRPYADGLIGLKHLYTRTSISDISDDEAIASNTDLSDTTLSYGFGGGLHIPLTKGPEGRLLLDVNVRYLRGSQAEYLKKGSIRQENGLAVFDVLSSRTDVIAVQIGVTFRF